MLVWEALEASVQAQGCDVQHSNSPFELVIYVCRTSPRKLADIRGNDIFADGERPDSVKPVSPRKAKELAGSMLKEIKASQALTPACAISTQRKRDNLLSVAFTSGEEELPVAAVSNYKKQHLSGNLPFPDEPVQLRYD